MKALVVFIFGSLVLLHSCKTGPKAQVYQLQNSRNTLVWPGEYIGLIPCADCEGIETIITLYKNETYSLKTKYRGKSTEFEEKTGKIIWDKKGNIVYLEGGAQGGYRVGEHKITQLDIEGNPIMGNLATKYILLQRTPGILERYWKLVELKSNEVVKTENMKREPYMILKEEQQRIAVQGGCNMFTGTYSLKGRRHIKVSKLSGTLLNCADMTIEHQFLQIINHANSYQINGDTLFLNHGNRLHLARFQAVYFE